MIENIQNSIHNIFNKIGTNFVKHQRKISKITQKYYFDNFKKTIQCLTSDFTSFNSEFDNLIKLQFLCCVSSIISLRWDVINQLFWKNHWKKNFSFLFFIYFILSLILIFFACHLHFSWRASALWNCKHRCFHFICYIHRWIQNPWISVL